MNILHITTFLQGGAGKIIRDIALWQKEKDNNVYIAYNLTEESGYCNYQQYLDELVQSEVELYTIDSTFKRDIYLNLNASNFVRNIISENNIDIIHAHAAVPALVGLLARNNQRKFIPVIQTMHGWGTNKTTEQEKMDIFILNSLDKVVPVSDSDKDLLIQKGANADILHRIYNGVEETIGIIKNDEIINDVLYYRKNGFTVIGSIGTLCRRKNQELLIEAMAKINKDRKIFCVFIGEGDILNCLQLKVKEYNLEDRIKFYGYKEAASMYMKYFDYMIFTSDSEGLSIALLECFREKVPVLVSSISSFTECVKHNITGFVFKQGDSSNLKELLEFITKNRNNVGMIKTIIKNAEEQFNKNYTLDKMLLNYNSLYMELLKGGHNV